MYLYTIAFENHTTADKAHNQKSFKINVMFMYQTLPITWELGAGNETSQTVDIHNYLKPTFSIKFSQISKLGKGR